MILLQDIIRNSAGHCREKPAVKTRFDQLRYAELDALTDRLAGHIEAAGLGRRRGGIVADNSLEYVVAYFSVTKAGGCVVPLSCHQPAARLSEELRASDLGYVITTPRHVGALPAAPGQAGMPGACWVLGERKKRRRNEGEKEEK